MPRNEQLYHRLRRQFGRVEIAHQGAPTHFAGAVFVHRGKEHAQIADPGEYYRVNCPFCGDQRGRLWINNSYGTPDPISGRPMTFLAICYNENCLSDPDNAAQLREWLLKFENARPRRLAHESVVVAPSTTTRALREMPWPGKFMPVAMIEDSNPVIQYLQQRRFDKRQLGQYGVGWCYDVDPKFAPAGGRLIAPISMRGVRVGWQARLVREPQFRGESKYYTCPGMRKSEVLYNFDSVSDMHYVIVVEGITDVWRVGAPAVAIFGKTLSSFQANLLRSTWRNKPIVVMLDGEARAEADAIVDQLAQSGDNPVVAARLPVGVDPADLSEDEVWQVIKRDTQRVGIRLT